MIYQNVDLHNVEEMVSDPESGGQLLQRVPENLRQHLNNGAQKRLQRCANSEIRFVPNNFREPVDVELQNIGDDPAQVAIYHGHYAHARHSLQPGERRVFHAEIHGKLLDVLLKEEGDLPRASFDPKVVRIRLQGKLALHRITGDCRLPEPSVETPARRILTYGTSITQGQGASSLHLNWASVCARRLDKDLINLGCGGSCFCEPQWADYIAEREDWNSAILELSVNMFNLGVSPEEFREKAGHIIERISRRKRRNIYCVSLLPFFHDLGSQYGRETAGDGDPNAYRQALEDIVHHLRRFNVHFIPGPQLLHEFTGLSADLIHPSDEAMIEIGLRLAEKIRKIRAL